MQSNGEIVVVCLPKLLEKKFCLATRIDEHKRRLVRLDVGVNSAERMPRRMAGPGQMLLGVEHRNDFFFNDTSTTEIYTRFALQGLRHEKAAKLIGIGNGR